jgi:putative redox protein
MSTTAPTTALTTAKISWVDGALFVAEGGSGHTLTMDGAPDIGGRNLASRPMEVVLMGMGGCTAIDVVAMLQKQRQDIEGVEISLTAERADEHPKVFTSVRLTYTVRGRKLNKALIERAVNLSDEKYCSATAMIRKSAKISHEVVLVEV